MPDPFNLQRFLDAQNRVLPDVFEELQRGEKRTHWIWFIFPQIEGLGKSPTSMQYAIRSIDEARAYCAHSILYDRLIKCCSYLFAHRERTAREILGLTDAQKLHSSMTLFTLANPDNPAFRRMIEVFFDGELDRATEAIVKDQPVQASS